MKRQSYNQGNSKVIFYVVALAVILVIGFVVQDIDVPTTHISQEVKVSLDK